MLTFASYASGSSGNLYTLSDGMTDILIECGLPYKEMQRLLPKAPTEYEGGVYSHSHRDHYNSKTAYELLRRGVYIETGFGYAMKLIGTILIRAFGVEHDVPNFGYLFKGDDGETCIFLIDTYYSPIVPDFSPTIIAIECNYASDLMKPGDSLNDRLFASHMSLDQCIKTLQAWDLSKTREIHLLHLSDDRSDEFRFVTEVEEATGIPAFAAQAYRRAGR